MIDIRPFDGTEQTYRELVALENAAWPEYIETIEARRHDIESQEKGRFFKRYMLYRADQHVGYGMYRRSKIANRQDVYGIHILVHPDCRGEGIGRSFFEFAMSELKKAEPKPTLIQATTREDQVGALAWLERLGYEKKMRYPVSVLDVTRFDSTPYDGLDRKLAQEGIEIKTFESLRLEDDQANYKLWDLVEHHVISDMPMLHERVITPYDEVKDKYFAHPEHRPDGNFIALYNDEYVGISSVWGKSDPDKIFVGITGVKPAYRRKGIATALKLCTIAYAKAHGFREIETDNEENNPMFEINVRLGFERQPAWAEFEKELK